MEINKLAILGAGNMGGSMAQGFRKTGILSPASITVSDPDEEKLEFFKQLGLTVTTDNRQAVKGADIIITAVKPYLTEAVLQEIQNDIDPHNQTLVIVAAGITSHHVNSILGTTVPLFLAMPNTASAICESMTCLASSNATQEQMNQMVHFFNAIGKTFVVQESLMGASTVLAACGTAFALRFIRAAMTGGIELGFKPDDARQIAAQMMKGASQLMFETNNNPEEEIDKVTTPKGITITGLNEMEHAGFTSAVIKGLTKSHEKVEKKK